MHRAEGIGTQCHRTEDGAGPHVDLDPAPGPVVDMECDAGTSGAGHRNVHLAEARLRALGTERCACRQHLGPPGTAQVGRDGWSRHVDQLDRHGGTGCGQAGLERSQIGRARRATDAHDATPVGA